MSSDAVSKPITSKPMPSKPRPSKPIPALENPGTAPPVTAPAMTPAESEARDLFRALELAHYAERFRDDVFVAALPEGVLFREMLLDVKVLTGYHIRLVLVCHESAAIVGPSIEVANKRGGRFRLCPLDFTGQTPAEETLRQSLAEGAIPVVASRDGLEEGVASGIVKGGGDGPGGDPVFALAGNLAQSLGARKLFLFDHRVEFLLHRLQRSSVQSIELEALRDSLAHAGEERAAELCVFIAARLAGGIPDVVVLEPRGGQMFKEAFTYEGAGLLCNATRESRIRRGMPRDVTDIGLLLRPEFEAGRIRAWSENEIEANIDNYWLYEMDGKVVGLACLKPHGVEGELAQFATLPRFRGKGRAGELALHLIEEARGQGMKKVFALSIDERMWGFFTGLGFRAIDRGELPEAWRRNYDMNRPSRAFILEL